MNFTIMLILDIAVGAILLLCLLAGLLRGFPKQFNRILTIGIPAVLLIMFLPKIVNAVLTFNWPAPVMEQLKNALSGMGITVTKTNLTDIIVEVLAAKLNVDATNADVNNLLISLSSVVVTIVVYIVALVFIWLAELIVGIVLAIIRAIFRIKLNKMKKLRLFGLVGGAVKFAILFVLFFMPIYGLLGTFDSVQDTLAAMKSEPSNTTTVALVTEGDDALGTDAGFSVAGIELGSYQDSYVKQYVINPVSKVIVKDSDMTFDMYYVGKALSIKMSETESCDLVEFVTQINASKGLFAKFNNFTEGKTVYNATLTNASSEEENMTTMSITAEGKEAVKTFLIAAQTTNVIFTYDGSAWVSNQDTPTSLTNVQLATTYFVTFADATKLQNGDTITFNESNGLLIKFNAFTDEEYDQVKALINGDSFVGKFIANVAPGAMPIIQGFMGTGEGTAQPQEGSISVADLLEAVTGLEKENWTSSFNGIGALIDVCKNYNGTGTEPVATIDTTDLINSLVGNSTNFNFVKDLIVALPNVDLVKAMLPEAMSLVKGMVSSFGLEIVSDANLKAMTAAEWGTALGDLIDAVKLLGDSIMTLNPIGVNTEAFNMETWTHTAEDKAEKVAMFNTLGNALDKIANNKLFNGDKSVYTLLNNMVIPMMGDLGTPITYDASHNVAPDNTCNCVEVETCECMFCKMVRNGWGKEISTLLVVAYDALGMGDPIDMSKISTVIGEASEGVYASAVIQKYIDDNTTFTGVSVEEAAALANVLGAVDPEGEMTAEDLTALAGALDNLAETEISEGTVDMINEMASQMGGSEIEVTAEQIQEAASMISDVVNSFGEEGVPEDFSVDDIEDEELKNQIKNSDFGEFLFDYLFGGGN